MSGERLLTVPEVAAYLRVSDESVRRWLRSGQMRGIRPGGTKMGWRIMQAEVDRFVREGGAGPKDMGVSAQGGCADRDVVTPKASPLPPATDES